MPEISNRRATWHTYGGRRFVGDVAGGLIAALVALPYGVALARLMGLPPELGLFTSILTAPVTALLGRNPVLIGGTASATVPFITVAVRAQGVGGSAKVCLVAAIFMMIFCVLRLGRHVARVPHAVVSGFSCGVGGMMVILQLRTLLGLPASPGESSARPIGQLASVLSNIGQARWAPLLLGLIVVAGALATARKWPRSPSPLIGVALAVAAASLLGWREKPLGAISLDWPSFVGFTWEPTDVLEVLPAALGLAFVASVNILITSKVVEHFQGRHRHLRAVDADGELGAYGIANLCAGVFGAPMSVGIPARSLANVRCGGTTRLSNLLHGVFLLGLLWFGSGLIARIPLAALAGVTAYVGLNLLEWSTWRRLHRMRRVDAAAFLVTAAAVLTTNAVAAVALGCSLYAVGNLISRLALLQRLPAVKTREAEL
ncbi:MAG: SulP family inorganic anion transporter [Isosphaeraceae bacterium]